MRASIIIPARYDSTRFPGKLLAKLEGKTLLQRVTEIALQAAEQVGDTEVIVATDHAAIADHARALSVKTLMTPSECKTGTERVLAAATQLTYQPQTIINLQGDAPFTPPEFIIHLLNELIKPTVYIATPVIQLTWQELDELRKHKQIAPFSGTTAIVNEDNQALWFSKSIIPAIRDELALRQTSIYSPVFQHIGLYGYRFAMLQKMASLPEGFYERIEGLEQLRILEHGFTIHAVKVRKPNSLVATGIDTPYDLERASSWLQQTTSMK